MNFVQSTLEKTLFPKLTGNSSVPLLSLKIFTTHLVIQSLSVMALSKLLQTKYTLKISGQLLSSFNDDKTLDESD